MNVLEMNEKQFSDLLDRITSGKEIKRDKNEKNTPQTG